jgi:hypothetical protein
LKSTKDKPSCYASTRANPKFDALPLLNFSFFCSGHGRIVILSTRCSILGKGGVEILPFLFLIPGALTMATRALAAMWNLRLAESVGNGATDAVVVTLDMPTLQARRRKKVVFVGINDVGTTPTRAQLNVLAT